ncbi:MAG: nicotinamide mononucleotide transporter, partial [Erysipelotrichaceae bacterium]|nr:nicotinamide mononucleotide transporter [Erysipelotrichaceae bacterium]
RTNIEKNKKIRTLEFIILAVLILVSAVSFIMGSIKINADPGELSYVGQITMTRDTDLEDYDEDSTVCDVTYVNGDKKLIVSYPYEEYVELDDEKIEAYEYKTEDGTSICFMNRDPLKEEVFKAHRTLMSEKMMPVFNLAISLLILSVSLLIMTLFSGFFTTYEKCWFLSIMVLATVMAVLFPEESANGVNGIYIMLLYLADTFLNILCELLISKQSRYNFLVSVLVEITEIAICIVLMYRFATMVVTLFFWLPIDILSFINWTKHKDEDELELTRVRRLKGYQEVLIMIAIAVWTLVVGYLISGLDISTDLYGGNRSLEVLVAYIDACASAVGIANGLFIFFRLREQWVAWYICAILEAVINILAGQYVLLVLKLGYFTNTTYGYIKWTRYIKTHREAENSLF